MKGIRTRVGRGGRGDRQAGVKRKFDTEITEISETTEEEWILKMGEIARYRKQSRHVMRSYYQYLLP